MRITSNSQKSELKKGTKITHTWTTWIGPDRTETKSETYAVTGHLNIKSGLRIRLLSEYGYGINDVDFEWEPEFPRLSSVWTVED
jgi:hypothetical protein